MNKENVKEKGITLGECYGLNRAVFNLLSSVPTMKGKIIHTLSWNENKLESLLKNADKKQTKILKKYVTLNEDGSYKLTELSAEEIAAGAQPKYVYKVESDREKAQEEIQALMDEEVDINLRKFHINDFNNLDIAPARNQSIGLLVKYLITEETDLHLA